MTTRQCIEIESNHNNFWEIEESETTALNFGSMVYPVLVPRYVSPFTKETSSRALRSTK
jgi:hypothetical protein